MDKAEDRKYKDKCATQFSTSQSGSEGNFLLSRVLKVKSIFIISLRFYLLFFTFIHYQLYSAILQRPYGMQYHKRLNAEADMRIQPFSIKPDT